MDQVYYPLRTSQAVIRAALFMHALAVGFWALLTGISGFSLYDAVPPAGFHAVGHAFFWLFIEIFVVVIGLMTASFDLETCERGLMLELKRKTEFMTFWTVVLVLAIAANVVHLVAAALELSDCRTTLCMLNNGFLIALIVLLGCVICLEILEIYIVYTYKKRMKHASGIQLKLR